MRLEQTPKASPQDMLAIRDQNSCHLPSPWCVCRMTAASFRPPVCGKQNLQSKNLPGAASFTAIGAGTSAIKNHLIHLHGALEIFATPMISNFSNRDWRQYWTLIQCHVGPYRH
jgi:hypothetical protein